MRRKLCKLSECPIGLFQFKETLCVKNEYNEYFIVWSGEVFWGGAKTEQERDCLHRGKQNFGSLSRQRLF